MQCLSCVHKATCNPETLHSRNRFPPHQPAFADAAYYKLTTGLIGTDDGLYTPQESLLRHGVGLVEQRHLRQRSRSRGENINSARDEARPFHIGRRERRGERLRLKFGAFPLLACRSGWWGNRRGLQCGLHIVRRFGEQRETLKDTRRTSSICSRSVLANGKCRRRNSNFQGSRRNTLDIDDAVYQLNIETG
jgi:hypothetical protein